MVQQNSPCLRCAASGTKIALFQLEISNAVGRPIVEHLIRNHGQRMMLGLLLGITLLAGGAAFAAQLPDETTTTIFAAHVRRQVSISLPSEVVFDPASIHSAQSLSAASTNDLNEVRILVGITDSTDHRTFTNVTVALSSSAAGQAFTVEPETILSRFQTASARATLKIECIDCP